MPASAKRRAVFLDRDGVLTRALVRDGRPFAPRSMHEFEILPDVAGQVAQLRQAGFVVIVATNQPDLATGALSRSVLDEMHAKLAAALPVDEIAVCPCLEDDPQCDCYKPRPGLLVEAAERWQIELRRSFMVGDRWRDVGAGKRAGCTTIFIDRQYPADRRPDPPDYRVNSLAEAVQIITRTQGAVC